MQADVAIPLLLVVFIPLYMLWRYSAAIAMRGRVAAEVDMYLGGEHPEDLKRIVFHSFNQCLSPRMPFSLLYYCLFDHDDAIVRVFRREHGMGSLKKMLTVVTHTTLVNISRAPLSYVFCGSILMTIWAVKIVLSASFDAASDVSGRLQGALLKYVS